MKIPALDSASEFGLSSIGLKRNDNGELQFGYDHPVLDYQKQNRFGSLVMRAMDSLPDGASGDKIISRILAQLAVDKRFSDLGQLGKNIPTNINVWHHAPQLVSALQEVNE